MKIRKSIENAIKKSGGKRIFATIRQDVVKRAIERGEFLKLKRAYRYTDDYAWDAENNFGRGWVGKEVLLQEYEWLNPSCWVDKKIHTIDGVDCYEISIMFHSNLAYDMYVPVA
jgi:hypothetical protein